MLQLSSILTILEPETLGHFYTLTSIATRTALRISVFLNKSGNLRIRVIFRLSRNLCCRGRAISRPITYSLCVRVCNILASRRHIHPWKMLYAVCTEITSWWWTQWRTEERVGGSNPLPPKFRSFDKAEPNFRFRGKYIHNNLIRIQVSLICKLGGTPDYGATATRSPFSLPSVLNWNC
jgi:hypothetical protein